MPIYEYRCRACATTLEVIQKVNDRPLRRCRECSGRLDKLISRTSFQLKGGGWYAHDYQSGSGGGASPESGAKASDAKKASSCSAGAGAAAST